MFNRKKGIIILLLLLVLIVTACSSKNPPADTNSSPNSTNIEETNKAGGKNETNINGADNGTSLIEDDGD